ncbi:hypothetical protein BC829DRAFT_442483 [Chytridium lagenaria]|nr:hypothetical protein BC829DRAFT_442483 [Chytridium lagenaria]
MSNASEETVETVDKRQEITISDSLLLQLRKAQSDTSVLLLAHINADVEVVASYTGGSRDHRDIPSRQTWCVSTRILTLLLSFTLATTTFAQLCTPVQPATNVPTQFNLNTQFYKKYLPGPGGLPIVGSAIVKDEALYRAQALLFKLAETMDARIFTSMVSVNIRNAIMAETEVTTDIPEHSDLTPKEFWDQRAEGWVRATLWRPAVSGAEENLLCTPGDRYRGECILLHELSHSIQEYGANALYPTFQSRLNAAHADAIAKGLWRNTYAATNSAEYWAEGAQSYFNCNAVARPADGVHNEIGNKEQLRAYDPVLFGLLDEIFRGASYSIPKSITKPESESVPFSKAESEP